MKRIAKQSIVAILGWQVRRLRSKHQFKIVAVVGSYGKTSTKLAIAQALSTKQLVRYQRGNYNDHVTVPLVFFDEQLPSLFNPFAWTKLLLRNETALRKQYKYDVVVLELGTDGPGQLEQFAKYLHIDLAIIAAVAPEHMEFFKSLDAVAREELGVASFSNVLLVNNDLVGSEYIQQLPSKSVVTYGLHKADYIAERVKNSVQFKHKSSNLTKLNKVLLSDAQLYSALAATTVCHQLLRMKGSQINSALNSIEQVPGRMNVLDGKNNSIIIDDTYNASPDATVAALHSLYNQEANKRIAILGNMNELGSYSQQAHEQVGEACDSDKLDLVVTIGPDANKWLAKTAEDNGCKVVRSSSPYEAANEVLSRLNKGTVVLAKGSQNNVYAEEAVKLLLANKKDERQLVRQSADWLNAKAKNFR